jgi:hypothetical protein
MKARGFGLSNIGKQQTTQLFQVGTKVYPSKIQVNADKDQVVRSIVACDSCNDTSPTTFYKADVIFQLPKGTLANANLSQVEDTIAGLLTIDASGDRSNNPQRSNQGGGQAQQRTPRPRQIQKGQTPEQVKAALGEPDRIANLGAKRIYIYKDLKVTFINGRVFDVQ